MFDGWVLKTAEAAKILRVCDPPRPILVDLNGALSGGVWLTPPAPPLWIRASGVRLDPVMPGQLIAWCRQSTSTWWAIVEVPISSGNDFVKGDLRLWTRAEHVEPDTPEARERAGFNRLLSVRWQQERAARGVERRGSGGTSPA